MSTTNLTQLRLAVRDLGSLVKPEPNILLENLQSFRIISIRKHFSSNSGKESVAVDIEINGRIITLYGNTASNIAFSVGQLSEEQAERFTVVVASIGKKPMFFETQLQAMSYIDSLKPAAAAVTGKASDQPTHQRPSAEQKAKLLNDAVALTSAVKVKELLEQSNHFTTEELKEFNKYTTHGTIVGALEDKLSAI